MTGVSTKDSSNYSSQPKTKNRPEFRDQYLRSSQSIELGNKIPDKNSFNLKSSVRKTHMHIIGSTGEGKSKFMEHMIRRDIADDNGLCLIDPHGYLYNDIIRWCESRRMLDRQKNKKIILFNPSEENWTFGFNPLQVDSPDIAYHVDAMVKAVATVWGGENTDRTPLLKRCLRVIFHALAEKNLSLLESNYLINPTDELVRTYLTSDIRDPTIQQQWDYFNGLKPKPFYDEFGSTINRMMEFLASPIIRSIVGQTQKTINFREIMNKGYVLLVNLASADKISDDNARLLGSLFVNDLFMKAKGRPEGSRPFYLYIDECALYINEDIRRILDEGRKFGLHLILAHQHLAQLKKAGEEVYSAVMNTAKTKVVFGGLAAEDAEVLANQLFLGELDLEEAKVSLNKPTVVRYIKGFLKSYSEGSGVSRGESNGTGEGESYGQSRGSGSTSSDSLGRTIRRGGITGESGPTGIMLSRGSSSGLSQTSGDSKASSKSKSHSSTYAETESRSEGESEALIPELEDRPSQVYSLEEQINKAMAIMVNQPTRHAIVKLPKKKTEKIIVAEVKKADGISEERINDFKDKCFRITEYANPKLEIENELQERLTTLKKKAIEYSYQDEEEPDSFRQ